MEEIRGEEAWTTGTSTPAVKIVNSALAHAIEEGASDIHFEPQRARARRPRPRSTASCAS